jgi:hypothetical protein
MNAVEKVSEAEAPLREKQLWLLDPPRPLRERLGDEFFSGAPPRPGVYLMTGGDGRVLYVGQSGNLRRRLASYKNARPGRVSRKLAKLVHEVSRITWEVCPDVGQARLRENELLRLHRPRFNVVNRYPEGHSFIGLDVKGGTIELRLTRAVSADERLHGAFKGAPWSCASLCRCLWWLVRGPCGLEAFPRALLGVRAPSRFVVEGRHGKPAPSPRPSPRGEGELTAAYRASEQSGWAGEEGGSFPSQPEPYLTRFIGFEDVARALDEYLRGESSRMVELFRDSQSEAQELSRFQQKLLNSDIEVLRQFYRTGPWRNRELRRRHGWTRGLIPGAALDDFLALDAAT